MATTVFFRRNRCDSRFLGNVRHLCPLPLLDDISLAFALLSHPYMPTSITHIHPQPPSSLSVALFFQVPFLPDICFNVRHIIDEDSPLSRHDWKLRLVTIQMSILGHDVYLGETVSAAKVYVPSRILEGGIFADTTTGFVDQELGECVLFDFTKLNAMKQDGQPVSSCRET